MYHYKSDATRFIDEFLEKNPQEAEQRLKNRSLLWDVELNSEEQAGFEAAKLPKKPYAYQPD
ncbi:DUF3460 family protein [Neisseria animaloris]|uniref:DUF3460 family protein n=1 Tax=Neisseria animaloris TaxID=326522 RepID=UPI0039E12163